MANGLPTCSHIECGAPARYWPRLTWAAQGDIDREATYSALLELPVCALHALHDADAFVTVGTWERIRSALHSDGHPPGDVATLALEFLAIEAGESWGQAVARSAASADFVGSTVP